MRLSSGARTDTSWWLENTESKAPYMRGYPALIIRSVASLKGFGGGGWGSCESHTAGGSFLQEEQSGHINELELLAAWYALKSFAKDKSDIHVRTFVDNTVAKTCVNEIGSIEPESLNILTKQLWE